MKLSRHARLHTTAGVDADLWVDFPVGTRVMTPEGFPGVVTEVLDGPHAGNENYIVELDAGMGGGTWGSSELSALDQVVAKTASADCSACGGTGEQGNGHECYICDGSGSAVEEASGRAAGIDNSNPENGLPVGIDLATAALGVELHVASEDYPELADILVERPPLEHSVTASMYPGGNPKCDSCHINDAVTETTLDGRRTHLCMSCARDFGADDEPEQDNFKSAGYEDLAEEPWLKEREVEDEKPIDYGTCDLCGGSGLYEESDGTRVTCPNCRGTGHYAKLVEAGPLTWAEDRWADSVNKKTNPEFQNLDWSYDWCRFRKDKHCMFSTHLDEEASEQAGYAVWTPENRGVCPRDTWDQQKACPIGEPGPHSGDPYARIDATVPWEEGGQRGGVPERSLTSAKTSGCSYSGEWHNSDGLSFADEDGFSYEALANHLLHDHSDITDLPSDLAALDQLHADDHGRNGECGAHEKPGDYSMTASLLESSKAKSFEFVSSWTDVRAKAKRIRSAGGVRIIAKPGQSGSLYITAEVQGDTNIYQTTLMREPGKKSIASWECGCAWSAYSWGRSGRWKRYEGRMCSHALALAYEAQAQEMFGGDIMEQPNKAPWQLDPTIPVKVPGDYEKKNPNGEWRVGVKGDGVDTCKACGSEELWGNFYDKDDYGVSDDSEPGSRWALSCADCGQMQDKPVRKGKQAGLWDLRSPDYKRNESRHSEEPCALCGRKLNLDKAVWVEVTTTGEVIPKGDPRSDGPESQGAFPVGPECMSKVRRMIREGSTGPFGFRPVWTDPELHDPPILGIAKDMLSEGADPNVVMGYLIENGVAAAPSLMTQALRRTAFQAKTPTGVVDIVKLLGNGVALTDRGDEVPVSHLLYPTYDPSLGLHLGSLVVAEANHTGVMVALVPPPDVVKPLLIEGGEPLEDAHITLAYLGKSDDVDEGALHRAVAKFVELATPLTGNIQGYGVFHNDQQTLYASWNIPGVGEFRVDLVKALEAEGLSVSTDYDFIPHMTLLYSDEPVTVPKDLPEDAQRSITFTSIVAAYGGEWFEYGFDFVRLMDRAAAFGDSAEDKKALEDFADLVSGPTPKDAYPTYNPSDDYGGYISQDRQGNLRLNGKQVEKLYRVVDPLEWSEAQRNGYLQSRGGYTRASAQPDARWRRQGDMGVEGREGIVLEIDYDPSDKWSASAEGYAATFNQIALSKVRPINHRWSSKLAGLSLEGYVSEAERVMEKSGLAGRVIHVPEGRYEDPAYQEAIAPLNAMVREWCGDDHIKISVANWDLDQAHAKGVTDGLNYIGVRAQTLEMTILHECAHIITGTSEGQGHNPEFCRVARDLYAKHISQEAADAFWTIVSMHSDIEKTAAGFSNNSEHPLEVARYAVNGAEYDLDQALKALAEWDDDTSEVKPHVPENAHAELRENLVSGIEERKHQLAAAQQRYQQLSDEYEAREKKNTIPEEYACTRCGGTGVYSDLGACFRCDGRGIDPRMDGQARSKGIQPLAVIATSDESQDWDWSEEARDQWDQEATAELHDPEEPALPTTTGETDDEIKPGDHRLAWLMDGSPKPGDTSNSEIAQAAQQFLAKTSGKTFTPAEQSQIINEGEGVTAGNLDLLQIAGTHYAPLEEALMAQENDEGWLW